MALIMVFRRLQRIAPPVADYDVDVRVTTSPTTTERVSDPIRVTGHRRADGYAMLLARYLQQHHPAALRAVMQESSDGRGAT